MLSPSATDDQRASPSLPTSASTTAATTTTTTSAAPLKSPPHTSALASNLNLNSTSISTPNLTTTPTSSSNSTWAWTRRLKLLPARPLADTASWIATAAFANPSNYGDLRNGQVTPGSLPHGHANACDAMTSRRSSYPSASSADPSGRPSTAQHMAAASTLDDGSSTSASSQTTSSADDKTVLTSSQQQLNEYRERLARDLELRELAAKGLQSGQTPDKTRVSPILEETIGGFSLINSAFATASTESGNTIRGGMTPALVASTPSYPFPRMGMPFTGSLAFPHQLQHPAQIQSPSVNFRPLQSAPYEYRGVLDRVLSENSTPASPFSFNPLHTPHPDNFDFPTPNLYDLSLMLSAEPGLDAWWNTVVQIMREVYKAERVTLAIPADTTDIENVPWGQKATYNEHDEDELSLGYLARGSSAMQSGDYDLHDLLASPEEVSTPCTPMRPGLATRHSFTTFEDNKEKSQDKTPTALRRPSHLKRSKTQHSSVPTTAELAIDHIQLNENTLEQHDSLEREMPQDIPSWEAPLIAQYEGQGRILPVLQALDYEADPLIDHTGVARVLERGRAVALTRTYPYLAPTTTTTTTTTTNTSDPSGSSVPSSNQKQSSKAASTDAAKKPKNQRLNESGSKLSSIFAGSTGSRAAMRGKVHFSDKARGIGSSLEEEDQRPPTPKYEEYEQTPPSPWSQSPAPSPAVRPDSKENPFFTDAMVDEDSFNPGPAPTDYSGMRPPEAIGMDNSWTVLHVPLTHVLLSKSPRPFKLDTTAMTQKSQSRSKDESAFGQKQPLEAESVGPETLKKDKPAPIAILSILTPVIPYPSNLRHSLEHLAPHLATSFSLCRHYTNLETELAGMRRRRPLTAGFGAVTPYGRPIGNAAYLAADGGVPQQSLAGSITSPSDYSGVSKSATGSPMGTPGWETSSLAYLMDKRQPAASPAAASQMSGSYFSSKQGQSSSSRQDFWGAGSQRSRTGSKDNSPGEKRIPRLPSLRALQGATELDESLEQSPRTSDDLTTTHEFSLRTGSAETGSTKLDDVTTGMHPAEKRIEPSSRDLNQSQQQSHTMLHSYGADFSSTFQSLPPSSSLHTRPQLTQSATGPQRAGCLSNTVADMPPPSDRLKGLILDSLPAHVFVAVPQTGEIVWVNSRYLSYRGQTVTDLSADPWGSIHVDDREEYLKAWGHSLRTGEQFSRTVRIKRFDGAYRWFYARAVASKDKRGVIMQFLGSYMDIHDQHIAELKAARQEEIEASEAKHRLLANLIPQIIFTATEDDGITFANERWLSYTGQSFEDSLRLGFMDFVHPEDLAKCRIPIDQASMSRRNHEFDQKGNSSVSSEDTSTPTGATKSYAAPEASAARGDPRGDPRSPLNRQDSSGSNSSYELSNTDLSELARKGVIKVGTDSNGRPSYTTEVRLRSKSGEYRWHLIRCVEIDTIDFGSGASSYFGSATDINDHKLLEAKLKEAMESKSRFLSNMSHEIRTPLIGISGMVSFLQDTTLNEEQRDYTNTIQTSANSLIMIINDILDLSKVDAGMMKLKFEWFHTRSLIEDVNELVSTMAIAKRLELNYLVEADVPAWVKGDKVRIRQVLLNVIGNAIKFTAEGEVFSRCRVFTGDQPAGGENEIMLEFSITDTGRGFSKEEKDLIFKPFSQIDGSSTRQHGGSGLGLVISRQLVELHAGTMEGNAVVGQGSTFTFTARFTLPTLEDRPNLPGSPGSTVFVASQHTETEDSPKTVKSLSQRRRSRVAEEATGTGSDASLGSPVVTSAGSSNQSVHSSRSHLTDRSSATSVNTGLARFSEAAKASGQDLSQMKLEMPTDRGSPGRTVTPDMHDQRPSEKFRPPMYSILIICPQYHSREATTQHIEMTLPKDVPHQITALGTVEEAEQFIGGDDPVKFTHIVINLGSAEAIISVMDKITKTQKLETTTILILSDSVQRQAVIKQATGTKYERLLSDNLVTFIYKPVKPSRFAVIFDPDRVRDLSTDWNRSTAQQMVESQKASYLEIERRMGNKGYMVLLVEDNPVNQKVLTKYLKKIGVDVEMAIDGVECTDKVLAKPHAFYSLILCDLHMPRKDGYQACREIRDWEKAANYPRMPIIALSANVMSDVHDKCVAAGFSDYVTKPVDFINLSRAMSKFF